MTMRSLIRFLLETLNVFCVGGRTFHYSQLGSSIEEFANYLLSRMKFCIYGKENWFTNYKVSIGGICCRQKMSIRRQMTLLCSDIRLHNVSTCNEGFLDCDYLLNSVNVPHLLSLQNEDSALCFDICLAFSRTLVLIQL